MALSTKSIETLVDLVDNKLDCMEVSDREDARELARLEKCRRELLELRANAGKTGKCRVVPFPAGDAESLTS
ncbi:MAG: hypothetical protein QNJ94_18950 [Alphaproteobacteria bacterium]|nr:hypothetical protein [Alphaproteobacteria bacterium]